MAYEMGNENYDRKSYFYLIIMILFLTWCLWASIDVDLFALTLLQDRRWY